MKRAQIAIKMGLFVLRSAILLSCTLPVLISAVKASEIPMDDMAREVLNGQGTRVTYPIPPQPWEWRVELSRDWDVLGPFPIHAREQHFLSPSFPIDLSKPYYHDPEKTWPSSYADNAQVTWTKAIADEYGGLAISFPDIRWDRLRKTEGWAALQHHTVLRTTLTVYPPEPGYKSRLRQLHVNLKQGSYFALVPRATDEAGKYEHVSESQHFVPEWHVGNIYDLYQAPPSFVELPGNVSFDKPNVYDLFVSGDYEIRLFGDPEDQGKAVPTLQVSLEVNLWPGGDILRLLYLDISPDFVDGWAFGNAIGVGLQLFNRWWTVTGIRTDAMTFPECINLSLLHEVVVAPSQTRVIPIQLEQHCAIKSKHEWDYLYFYLTIVSLDPAREGHHYLLPVRSEIRNVPFWASNAIEPEPIKATYFSATSHPTVFLAKPPINPPEKNTSPVLALHGAGVDVIRSPFWANAVQRQARSWIAMPTGRTEWGLDWHGPSASEAFASLRALNEILDARYPSWSFGPTTKVTLVGHSNGGQGVWYLASRYPDRVQAAVPAAGYLKSQAYVPLTQSRAGHFIDPSLRAILESSLTPDDNDLFMSNVARMPVLAVHGGEDTNVPTWHSREYYSVVKSWGDGLNITFQEDEGEPHWYPEVLKSTHVQRFLDHHLNSAAPPQDVTEFTLTVANPAHSGSLHGWAITELTVPGRLARLHVRIVGDRTYVRTINVRSGYAAPYGPRLRDTIVINNEFEFKLANSEEKMVFTLSKEGTWTLSTSASGHDSKPLASRGRVQNILDTPAPFTLVIPNPAKYPRPFSAALRIAHVLQVYHQLDAEIVTDNTTASLFPTSNSEAPAGNIVIIGGPENRFGVSLLGQNRTEFRLENGVWAVKERLLREPGLGIAFTHPHPTNPSGLALFVAGTDEEGLERALRLFPFRTGVPVPDWIVIGREADRVSAAGVVGAGVWSEEWKWNEAMSWLS